jgi:hypothetical protein
MVVKENARIGRKLVTNTAEDIAEMEVTGNCRSAGSRSGISGKSIYQVSRSPGDHFGFTELEITERSGKKPRCHPPTKNRDSLSKISDRSRNYGVERQISDCQVLDAD